MPTHEQRRLSLIEDIDERVRVTGKSPEEVATQYRKFVEPSTLVDEALGAYRERIQRIGRWSADHTLTEGEWQPWYPGVRDSHVFWPAHRNYLENDKGWPADVIESVHEESDTVVSRLDAPYWNDVDTRGLVIGHVQSGKTANFTAAISKAADQGYDIFIVLAGVTNSLRRQTQRRLDQELVDLNRNRWLRHTNAEADFDRPPMHFESLMAGKSKKALFVVKKNHVILRKLIDWIGSADENTLRGFPALIIDDEADYASINTRGDEDERSKINALILELLSTLPRAAYVGYTATPFANVLINPNAPADLYPRSFIHALPTPEAYFGPETIFGRHRLEFDDPEEDHGGHDMIRIVPEEELPRLSAKESEEDSGDFEPDVTESLSRATRYFILATAARHVREEEGFFSTMLVHTDVLTIVQNRMGERLREEIEGIRNDLRLQTDALMRQLEGLWREEANRVPSGDFGLSSVEFGDLEGYIPQVLEELEILVVNSTTDDTMDYEAESGTYVVVGGNVLSRGLTLEGLLVSFFVRMAGNYDTLLQMGRWFGYWEDYADLPRLWMTSDLKGYFYDLATVEREIRNDVRRYHDLDMTPLEFAVRIRTHPELNITSLNKMDHTQDVHLSYTGDVIQTTWFRHRDKRWLQENLEATRSLIRSVRERDGDAFTKYEPRYRWIARDVAVELIQNFLSDYSFHPNHDHAQPRRLLSYIDRQVERGHLKDWNVGIIGQRVHDLGKVDLSLPEESRLIQRTKMRDSTPDPDTAYIKALISRQDLLADLEEPPTGLSYNEYLERRDEALRDRGLLLFYPIAKDSDPGAGATERAPLDASEHVIGVAMVFPHTDDLRANVYKQVRLNLETEE